VTETIEDRDLTLLQGRDVGFRFGNLRLTRVAQQLQYLHFVPGSQERQLLSILLLQCRQQRAAECFELGAQWRLAAAPPEQPVLSRQC
jgi:hypothetical protein